ncbi:SseB family protein [Legionella tunisiensis]|uniref:SseB family protein n=1 Tax=Legionella tunisiensis TaxID=1034944 RepID=UPI0002FA43C8|nr:SseB family protein [Legionella tunisiensis]
MNDLELAIKHALDATGNSKEANKAYLEFIKANFIIPIDKNSAADQPEVLYLENNGGFLLPVFTNRDYFDHWACEISDAIQLLRLSGVDLLKGIGEQVTVCLNIGSPIYKEFNPAELARMRSMVLKLFK